MKRKKSEELKELEARQVEAKQVEGNENGKIDEPQISMMMEFDDKQMYIVFGNEDEAIEFAFSREEAQQIMNDINEWLEGKGEQNNEGPAENTIQ